MTATESAAQDDGQIPWHQKRVVAWIVLVLLWLVFVPKWLVLLPLYGALARYRAHYRPLRSSADAESKSIDAAKFPVRWYHAVFPRVWTLEGWAGLWKGAVPCVFYFIGWTVYQAVFDRVVGYSWRYDGVHRLVILFVAEVAWVPFSVPLTVLLNREITHSQLLDWARWRSPGRALSSLFPEGELARPKVLLCRIFLPLLAAESLSTAIIWGTNQAFEFLAMSSDHYIKDHGFEGPPPREFEFTREFFGKTWPWIVAILILVLFKALPAVIVCPLEVAAVRISSQRSSPGPDDISAQSAAPVPAHEPVIRLRDAPYDGLFDCLRSMVREEGWRALYSACWATLLFTIHGLSWRMIAGMRFP